MARKLKQIVIEGGLDRRDAGYYSTPQKVAEYIHSRLRNINPQGKSVIDPCVGREELLQPFLNEGVKAAGIDIIDHKTEYACSFLNRDFIEIYNDFKFGELFNHNHADLISYDYWVANPPYNCHEVDYIKSNKAKLKKTFSDVGVHNMYSMFISAIIDIAKNGATIGLITLDSFLTSKAHKELRLKILNTCKIHEILLCPTELFQNQNADVRTCIIILEKESHKNNQVLLLNRPTTNKEFYESLSKRDFEAKLLADLTLTSDNDSNEFLIGVPDDIKATFINNRIGELFPCITGISTGNDKKYLRKDKQKGFTVPFYKNPGSRKFFCKEDGYLIDHFLQEKEKVKNFMVRNTSLIFKPGITCSSMGVEFSACYLPEMVTFGVNPNIICPEDDIWWLLAYLNSNLVKYIVRGILIRTNMITSGYVARIPVIAFQETEKRILTDLAKGLYNAAMQGKTDDKEMERLNKIVYQSAKISKKSSDMIFEFCNNIVKKA